MAKSGLWLALLLAWPATAAISFEDASGHTLTIEPPARRIISLAPHLTELLFAIGAGDRLVATARYSDYPAAAKTIPRIGDAHNLDIERILALAPDLILGWKSGNPAGQLQKLQQLGLPIYISEPEQLDDIPALLETLGRLTGNTTRAAQAAAEFRRRAAALGRKYRDRPPVSVFYQIWDDPLFTIAGDHIINDVIRLCGGRNVFAGIDQLAPQVSIEAVLAVAPEVIVASGGSGEKRAGLDDWQAWPRLPAVRNGQLYYINPDYLQRHTPRLLKGAAKLCAVLQQAREQGTAAQSGQNSR